MSALALYFLGSHFLAVKEVLHGNVHGELLVGIALVVDIAAVSLPAEVLAAELEFLVALYVDDIAQVGDIGDIDQSGRIFQPVAYHHVLY